MTKNLTRGNPMRLILSFGIPILFGYLFQQLYNVVDTAIVGKTLGGAALAAVGSTGSVNFLVVGFCAGVCGGFAIPAAQQFGAGDEKELRRYVTGGAWLTILFGAALTAATLLLGGPVLTIMNTPADIYDRAYIYIMTIFAGLPGYFLYNYAAGVLRALGDSRTPVIWLIAASLLNIVLDFVFILTFHMDVFGAAFATILSQAIAGVGCLVRMCRGFPVLKMEKGDWRWDWRRARELCVMGLPMGLQYSITAIGSVMIQAAVNGLGTVYVTAVTAASKVSMFLCCPFDAMGATMATYGGQNVGAAKWERLDQGLRSCTVLGAVYAAVSLGIVFSLRRSLEYAVPGRRKHLPAAPGPAVPAHQCRLLLPPVPGEHRPVPDPGHGLLPPGHPGRGAGDGRPGLRQLSGAGVRLCRRLLRLPRRLGAGGHIPGPRLLLLPPEAGPAGGGPPDRPRRELPVSSGCQRKTSPLPQAAGTSFLLCLRADVHEGHPPADGVLQGPAGAAPGPVVNGDDQGAVVHHVPVAAEHTVRGVPLLDQGLQVAGRHQVPPPPALRRRPPPALTGAGDGRLQGHARAAAAQVQHRLGEVEVTAPGHAADEVPHPLLVGRLHRVPELLLQPPAPRVPLIPAPGQLLRPVSGEAAGPLPAAHGLPPFPSAEFIGLL